MDAQLPLRPRTAKSTTHTFCCSNIGLNYPLTIDSRSTAINARIAAFMTHARNNTIAFRPAPLAPYHFRVILTKLMRLTQGNGEFLVTKETQLRVFAPNGPSYCEIETPNAAAMASDHVPLESNHFPILQMWKCRGVGDRGHHTQLHVYMVHLHNRQVDPTTCEFCVQGEVHREAEDAYNRELGVGPWGGLVSGWGHDEGLLTGGVETNEGPSWEEDLLRGVGLGREAAGNVTEVGFSPESANWML